MDSRIQMEKAEAARQFMQASLSPISQGGQGQGAKQL
jgi:hypothetical protein